MKSVMKEYREGKKNRDKKNEKAMMQQQNTIHANVHARPLPKSFRLMQAFIFRRPPLKS